LFAPLFGSVIMLGHLVSNAAYHPSTADAAAPGWFKRMIAFFARLMKI